LLLCAKPGGWDVNIVGENAEESPYVAMTTKLTAVFPNRGGVFQIEPDASSGSYFWAAMTPVASLERAGRVEGQRAGFADAFLLTPHVTVKNWPRSGWQADQQFPVRYTALALRAAGSPTASEGTRPLEQAAAEGTGANPRPSAAPSQTEASRAPQPITMSRSTDLGDSIMTAIVMAPLAACPVRFTDLGRLRLQECERVVALHRELEICGAKIIEEGDTLTVYPSQLHGAEIETYNDHRMAMCFAILGLKVPRIKIKNPACVKKTFPNFFQKLATPPPKGLGATILDAKTGRKLEVSELFAE
jgi:3-phosphoshikimate 1-carboxyvinyltransferase